MPLKTEDLGGIPMQNIVQSLADIKHELEELTRAMEKVRREGGDVSEVQGRARVAESRRDTLRGQMAQQNQGGYASVYAEQQAFKVSRGEINAINQRLGMDALAGRRASISPNEAALVNSLRSIGAESRANQKYNADMAGFLSPRHGFNQSIWEQPIRSNAIMNAALASANPSWNSGSGKNLRERLGGATIYAQGAAAAFRAGGAAELRAGLSGLKSVASQLGVGSLGQAAVTGLAYAGLGNFGAMASALTKGSPFVAASAIGNYAGNVIRRRGQYEEAEAKVTASLYGDFKTYQWLRYSATATEINMRQTVQQKYRDKSNSSWAYTELQGGANIAGRRAAEIQQARLNLEQQYHYGFSSLETGLNNLSLKQRAMDRDENGNFSATSMVPGMRALNRWWMGNSGIYEEQLAKRIGEMSVKILEARERDWNTYMEKERNDPTYTINNYENLLKIRQVEEWKFEKSMQWNSPE